MCNLRKGVLAVFLSVIIVSTGCKENSKSNKSSAGTAKRNNQVIKTVTLEQLEKTGDDQIEHLVFSVLVDMALEDYDREMAVVNSWTPGKQMLYSTWILEGEVNNGGFHQYFWNTEGKHAQMALAGYRMVGAKAYANITERAIETYETEKKQQQKFKDKGTVDAFSESNEESKLDALDNEFYKLKEDVSAMRVKYIKEHLQDFVVKPSS